MKVAFVSSEVVPFAKTGGLADVSGSLPKELEKLGAEVKVFMPKYYSVDEHRFNLTYSFSVGEMKVRVAGHPQTVHVFEGLLPNSNIKIYFIDCPKYFHRQKIYTDEWDEDERFILFSKAVIELLQILGWSPDIIHCNDWQTGLLPLLLRDNYGWDRMFDHTATVFTIHNIAYQGRFSGDAAGKAELREGLFYPGGPIEFEGGINFMKAGIIFADVINTVSETYAKELLTPEYGAGMNDFLSIRRNDLYGILNGIDYSIWNPATDKYIPHNYSPENLAGKLKTKKHVLSLLNLPYKNNVPLIGIVSRLVIQKGLDLISEAMSELITLNAQWLILGSGDHNYEKMFNTLHAYYPDKVLFHLGYNEELAHLIEAASDIFVMPSKYEPCGLNQIYSLKYGTVPVVRKTGGLADTVQDWNEYNSYGMDTGNGFSFNDYSGYALVQSIKRAMGDYYNKPIWHKIQMNGMNKDYSWHRSAEKYMILYNIAKSKRK